MWDTNRKYNNTKQAKKDKQRRGNSKNTQIRLTKEQWDNNSKYNNTAKKISKKDKINKKEQQNTQIIITKEQWDKKRKYNNNEIKQQNCYTHVRGTTTKFTYTFDILMIIYIWRFVCEHPMTCIVHAWEFKVHAYELCIKLHCTTMLLLYVCV